MKLPKKAFISLFVLLIITGGIYLVCSNLNSKRKINQNYKKDIEFIEVNNIQYSMEIYPLLQAENHGGLIGFDDSYYYISYSRENNQNFSMEYVKYDRSDEVPPETIYQTSKCYATVFDTIYDNKLYVTEVFEENNYYKFQLVEVDINGTRNILFDFSSQWFPEMTRIDNNIIIVYTVYKADDIEKREMEFLSIDLDSNKFTIIDRVYNNIDDQGYNNGTIIKNIGGNNKLLYFTKIYFENVIPINENDGEVILYRYSYHNNKTEELGKLNKVLSYLSGADDFVITSDYSYFSGIKETGNIYLFGENRNLISCPIPDIKPIQDIRKVFQISENLVMICNTESIYLYDISSYEYQIIPYNESADFIDKYQVPMYYNGKIGYLVNLNSKNEIYFHEITINIQ